MGPMLAERGCIRHEGSEVKNRPESVVILIKIMMGHQIDGLNVLHRSALSSRLHHERPRVGYDTSKHAAERLSKRRMMSHLAAPNTGHTSHAGGNSALVAALQVQPPKQTGYQSRFGRNMDQSVSEQLRKPFER